MRAPPRAGALGRRSRAPRGRDGRRGRMLGVRTMQQRRGRVCGRCDIVLDMASKGELKAALLAGDKAGQ